MATLLSQYSGRQLIEFVTHVVGGVADVDVETAIVRLCGGGDGALQGCHVANVAMPVAQPFLRVQPRAQHVGCVVVDVEKADQRPWATKLSTSAAPMPVAPPVTKTCLPRSEGRDWSGAWAPQRTEKSGRSVVR